MSSRIDVYDDKDYRSVVADWVELHTLIAVSGAYSSSEIGRARSILEDSDHGSDDYDGLFEEDVDAEIADLDSEESLMDVLEELRLRARNLGDLYPFEISNAGANWRLERRSSFVDRPTASGRVAYLACLISSAIRNKTIVGGEDEFDRLCKLSPWVVQALSVIASAQLMNGTSYWFGWPRPDATSKMRSALDELVKRLGYGVIKGSDPAWTTGREKDGTVDVVAWHPFADGTWSNPTLFGQVASGMNWRSKPISAFFRGRFLDWFEDAPAETVMGMLGAMFIPYPLHHDTRANKHNNFETVARGKARSDYLDFGVVVDRLRMVRLVAQRQASRPDDPYILSTTKGVTTWTRDARNYLLAIPAGTTV